jgi:hypothetical protein
MQKGYELGDRVIRPARVGVADPLVDPERALASRRVEEGDERE